MQFTEHVLETLWIPTFFCLLLYGVLRTSSSGLPPSRELIAESWGTPSPAQILLVNLQPGVIV